MSKKKYTIDTQGFKDINNAIYPYILGYIWADGYLYEKNNSIELYTSVKDIDNILNIFNNVGNWYVKKRIKYLKKTNKFYISYTIGVCDKELSNYLLENDFKEKSLKSPNKILKLIPKKYHSDFYRGYSDGDGSFSLYNNKKTCNYNITSSINQDWWFIENIFQKLDIKYKIYKYERNSGNSSSISISNKWDIIKIGDYLYQNSNDVRLERKYLKYQDIKKSKIKKAPPKWTKKDIKFLTENYFDIGVNECSKRLNRSVGSIYTKIHRLKSV